MRFAIVSDIHGNLPALNAVIEDAEKNILIAIFLLVIIVLVIHIRMKLSPELEI